MINAGSLIQIHYHRNLSLLEQFSETNNVLYYRNQSLFQNLEISQAQYNCLVKRNDGLYVDGSFLSRISYHDDELYFDNIIIGREYTDNEITSMVDTLWANNPYEQIGKIDLTYWFKLITSNDKTLAYQNISDSNMGILISNPNAQLLKIEIDGGISYSDSESINATLLPEQQIIVRETNSGNLQDVTVTLR